MSLKMSKAFKAWRSWTLRWAWRCWRLRDLEELGGVEDFGGLKELGGVKDPWGLKVLKTSRFIWFGGEDICACGGDYWLRFEGHWISLVRHLEHCMNEEDKVWIKKKGKRKKEKGTCTKTKLNELSNKWCSSGCAYYITLISIQRCTKRGISLNLFHTIYTYVTQI